MKCPVRWAFTPAVCFLLRLHVAPERPAPYWQMPALWTQAFDVIDEELNAQNE